ncbi:MAG: PilZ domain-containing protein [Elusimicrobia bacterium]|nr:PilZ domain-containing protein [Elusimicrobiota bacterium]
MEQERRRHPRFNLVEGLIEPVTIRIAPQRAKGPALSHPGILTDLSAGGVRLTTFLDIPKVPWLDLSIKLPELPHISIRGKVLRVTEKSGVYALAIRFTKIKSADKRRIRKMALDNHDCNTRISLNLPDACVPHCTFHGLCAKPQKRNWH